LVKKHLRDGGVWGWDSVEPNAKGTS
jgi:hypothetical protein